MDKKAERVFEMNCGIHCNTPEIRERLEKIGYKLNGGTESNIIITNCETSEYYTYEDDFMERMYYDCGSNVDLFLALAALRIDGSDQYQLFKLPDDTVAMCECESYIDMWGDFEDGNYPVKMCRTSIIIYYEPKILVIYVNSAEDTEDLKFAYEGLDVTLLYNPTPQQVTRELRVTSADTVMILGHGSPSGLFTHDWHGNAVDARHVHYLRNKKCIGVWCYASEFAIKYDLKGFFTSMFISNKWEAACHGFKGENEEIYEQTRHFLRTLNKLIKDNTPMEEWLKVFDESADMSIPYVKFNYEALGYFD